MHRALTPAIAQMICVGVLLVYALGWTLTEFNIYGSDFAVYYTGATIANNGDGRSLYDTDVQKAVQSRLISPYTMKQGFLPFNYPPWSVVPFLPLAKLPYEIAYFIWLFVNVGLFLIGLRLLNSALPAISSSTNRLAMMWVAAVSFFPLVSALLLGQLTVVIFLGYVLCFIALRKGEWFRAGLALALALVKPQLVVVLPLVLLYKRRWRALLGLGSGLAGLAVASILSCRDAAHGRLYLNRQIYDRTLAMRQPKLERYVLFNHGLNEDGLSLWYHDEHTVPRLVFSCLERSVE